jgi:amidase
MARSADDLLATLKIIGGPMGWDAKAWKWELPASRHETLKGFRVGYVLDDPTAPPVLEVSTLLQQVVDTLARAGATL